MKFKQFLIESKKNLLQKAINFYGLSSKRIFSTPNFLLSNGKFLNFKGLDHRDINSDLNIDKDKDKGLYKFLKETNSIRYKKYGNSLNFEFYSPLSTSQKHYIIKNSKNFGIILETTIGYKFNGNYIYREINSFNPIDTRKALDKIENEI